MLIEALGIVFVCGGLAIMLDVSFLIASMVMGAVITNLARHHEYPFHAIEGIEWPFMVIFFVLAGVAIGMALVASEHFPEYRQTLLSVVISATIFFEIIGPVFTRMAIQRAQNT